MHPAQTSPHSHPNPHQTRREHRLMPRHRSQQRRANSCWFLMVSFSKPNRARRRRRTFASSSWSSTPSFCNRFGELFSRHQLGRVIGARLSSPESPQNSESVQDYPNPCKIGGHLNPATTNGFARASRAQSVGEN